MKRKSFLSLYSGCGGLDAGFHEMGYHCEAAFDVDHDAVATYIANYGRTAHRLDLTAELTPAFKDFRNIDIVLSGAPCQGFSTVGRRQLNDPRNHLLARGAEIAISLQAKLFVCENVMGSVQGSHVVHWNRVARMFSAAGYDTSFSTVNTLHLGLPQSRKRVIFIASRNGSAKTVTTQPSGKAATLHDVIHHLSRERNPSEVMHSPLAVKVAPHIKPGQKVSDVRGGRNVIHTWQIPSIFPETTTTERLVLYSLMKLRRANRQRSIGDSDPVSKHMLDRYLELDTDAEIGSLRRKQYISVTQDGINIRNGFNGLYRRLSLDLPSNTVDTRFGNPRLYLHPLFDRGFSVTEASIIQGFDASFKYVGAIPSKFRMIGNSVSPVASRYLATSLA